MYDGNDGDFWHYDPPAKDSFTWRDFWFAAAVAIFAVGFLAIVGFYLSPWIWSLVKALRDGRP